MTSMEKKTPDADAPRVPPSRQARLRPVGRLRDRHHGEVDRRGDPRLRHQAARRRPRRAARPPGAARAVHPVHRAGERHVPEPAEPGQPAPAGCRADHHRDGPGVRAAHRGDRSGGGHGVRPHGRVDGAAPRVERQPARRDGHHGLRAVGDLPGGDGRAGRDPAHLVGRGVRGTRPAPDGGRLPTEPLAGDAARDLHRRGDRHPHRLPRGPRRDAVVRGHPRPVHRMAGRDPAAHRRGGHAGSARPGDQRSGQRQPLDGG